MTDNTNMGRPGLVFNPSEVPVMDEDAGRLVEGLGWGVVDLDGEWAVDALETGRIVAQPDSLTTRTQDINPAAYVALEEIDQMKKDKDDSGKSEEAVSRQRDSSKPSRKDSPRMRDTGSDAKTGADKTGTTKE